MAFGDDSDDEIARARILGLYFGIVTDNADPEVLGRVKANVPGILEPTDWAWPAGQPGSGSAQRGMYAVPEVGATVVVGFIQGDPEEAIYFSGPWGAPQGLRDTPSVTTSRAPAAAPLDRAFETPTFAIEITEQPTDRRLVLRNKRNGAMVEIDDRDNSLTISSPTAITIRSGGVLRLEGFVVEVADNLGRSVRRVLPYGDRI